MAMAIFANIINSNLTYERWKEDNALAQKSCDRVVVSPTPPT